MKITLKRIKKYFLLCSSVFGGYSIKKLAFSVYGIFETRENNEILSRSEINVLFYWNTHIQKAETEYTNVVLSRNFEHQGF
jgi:hypothetical protein